MIERCANILPAMHFNSTTEYSLQNDHQHLKGKINCRAVVMDCRQLCPDYVVVNALTHDPEEALHHLI